MTDAERQDMTCATCVWFRRADSEEAARSNLSAAIRERSGECRRNPPVASGALTLGSFPLVIDSDWCGEWRK